MLLATFSPQALPCASQPLSLSFQSFGQPHFHSLALLESLQSFGEGSHHLLLGTLLVQELLEIHQHSLCFVSGSLHTLQHFLVPIGLIELAQIMQSWLPAPTAPDPSSQQRILDLEAQLATLKGQQSSDAPATGSTPSGSTTTAPIVQALHGQQPSAPTFSPQSLLTMPGSPHPWLEANSISSFAETAYKKWLRDLQLYLNPKRMSWRRNLPRPWNGGTNSRKVRVIKSKESWWAWASIRQSWPRTRTLKSWSG